MVQRPQHMPDPFEHPEQYEWLTLFLTKDDEKVLTGYEGMAILPGTQDAAVRAFDQLINGWMEEFVVDDTANK